MSAQPMHFVSPAQFRDRVSEALADEGLRDNFRSAMNFLRDKRAGQFPDPVETEALRDLGEAVRKHALAHLPALLEKLETNLQARGVEVHWAETPEEACAIIHRIATEAGATRVIKGKSMVSEEVELNHYLEARGVECLESDMGEYIVQLAGERPSHIVMPAIHKTKQDIARLFEQKIPDAGYTEDVDALIRTGREVLRERFMQADIGISGVNFAIAETGTLWLDRKSVV